jgi:hypothetical protein
MPRHGRHLLILATVLLIFGAVVQEHAVQLDVIFSQHDRVMAIEDHVHRERGPLLPARHDWQRTWFPFRRATSLLPHR